MTERTGGHSVLVIPVPELNGWLRERTAYYDDSFLPPRQRFRDAPRAPQPPEFVNAHITLLGPWISRPTEADLGDVAAIAHSTPAFEYRLHRLGCFPDGIIYLDPWPAEPFTALTAQLTEAFPDYAPYGGVFGSVIPHLTLDQTSDEVTIQSVEASLGGLIPATAQAVRIDLQWWENHNCHVMASWDLG